MNQSLRTRLHLSDTYLSKDTDEESNEDEQFPGGARCTQNVLPMGLRIEKAIWVIELCSSASQVISEDSDLYLPFEYPTG